MEPTVFHLENDDFGTCERCEFMDRLALFRALDGEAKDRGHDRGTIFLSPGEYSAL